MNTEFHRPKRLAFMRLGQSLPMQSLYFIVIPDGPNIQSPALDMYEYLVNFKN